MTKWLCSSISAIVISAMTIAGSVRAEETFTGVTESRFIIYLNQNAVEKEGDVQALKRTRLTEWQKVLKVSIDTLPSPDYLQWVIKISGSNDTIVRELYSLVEKDPALEEIEADHAMMPM